MSVQSEITRLMSAKADLKSAIEAKGVSVPSATKLDGYASLLSNIPTGGIIPSGNLSISANGTYNVEAFATASVMVEGGSSNDGWVSLANRTISGAIIDSEGSFTSIPSCAFYQCSRLTFASFPSVTSIYASAFYQCSNIQNISFPIATYIESYAFCSCYNLTSVSFPSVSSIGIYAFYSCSMLSKIYAPRVSDIMSYAFYGCKNLISVDFPSATLMMGYAFYLCYSLTNVNLPLISSVYSYAFYNCRSLMSASFPRLFSLGSSAFCCCSNLSTVFFSNTSTSAGTIYPYAFRSCYNLLSVYLLASNIYKLSSTTVFNSTPISNYTTSTGGVYGSIFVPESLYSSYISSTYWSYFSSRFASLTDTQIQNVLTYGTHNPT